MEYIQTLNLITAICILVAFLIILIPKKSVRENYSEETDKEDEFNKDDLGCSWDYEKETCSCANYTPSLVNILPKNCNNCNLKRTDEECLKGQTIKGASEEDRYFYCNIDGKCQRRLVNFRNSVANNCGYNNHMEMKNPVYTNKKECYMKIDKCGEFNHSKNECLNNKKGLRCGWCTDANGKGICVESSGIMASNQDYKCRSQSKGFKYNFTPGNTINNQFIMGS